MPLNSLRRLASLLRRSRLDDELAEEIRSHLEMRRQALIDDGMDPRTAEYEARRLFGNVTTIREETHDMWGFPSIDTLLQDVRYGARLLGRSRMFTSVAVLSLAIGIGAAAAVFSLADAVLFRKLPVKAPDELIVLRWISGPVQAFQYLNGNSSQNDTELSSTSFSLPTFEKLRQDGAPYADLFGFAALYQVNLSIGGRAEIGTGQVVSGNYFDVLGIPPAAGRPLVVADDRAGAVPVAVISHDYWRRRFAQSPSALGQTFALNGVAFTIVGVSAEGFRGTLQVTDQPDVTIPLAMRDLVVVEEEKAADPRFWWVLAMGRLKPGITAAGAQAALDGILKNSVAAHRPDLAARDLPRLDVLSGARGQIEDSDRMRNPLITMAAVVAVVLLVACANVANLLLARGQARSREIAVRVAIGAPRSRVVRQLLTEGLLLAAFGSMLGLLVTRWMVSTLMPALADSPALAQTVGINWRVLGFTALVASACSVAFGLVPALRTTDISLASGLQDRARGVIGSRRRFGLPSALVVVQVALSMLLVTGAGLLVNSVRNLERVDPGFDPSNTLIFSVDPTLNGYKGERSRGLYMTALDRLAALPGVRSASLSSHTLISGSASMSVAALPGAPAPEPGSAAATAFFESHRAWRLVVDDHFFATMRIPILRGRAFAPRDSLDAQQAAVVNSALARQLFGSDDAVGKRFKLSLRKDAPILEVIGVCADAKYTSMRREFPPTVYMSYRQQELESMTFAVKTAGDPLEIVPSVRAAMREIDPDVPLVDIQSQEGQIQRSMRQERLFAKLATLLGLVTLLLSGIGLYGLLAYSITRRTAEIGIRMALGAERHAMRWMVMQQSLRLVALGVAVGVPAAIWATRLLDAMLFGLSPTDPLTFAQAVVLMLAVSAAAAYVPARRAARVDPVIALRAE